MLFIFVGFGCALGGLCRYALGGWLDRRVGSALPWGTLTVNLLGSFLLGTVFGLTTSGTTSGSVPAQAFFGIGFCGGLTTFSAFSLQNLDLLARGAKGCLVANILFSLVGCLLSALAGYALAERWVS